MLTLCILLVSQHIESHYCSNMANVGGGRGRGGRGEARGNTNDSEALLSRGVVWSDPLIEILLSMYEEKYIGQNYNPAAKHQWQAMLSAFNERANVLFNRDNLISKIDSLKRKWKAEKKEKNYNRWHSLNMDLV